MRIPGRHREVFRQATSPTPEQVEEQVDRIRRHFVEPPGTSELLRRLPAPSDRAIEALVARVSATLDAQDGRRSGLVAWLMESRIRSLSLVALALAAVLLGTFFIDSNVGGGRTPIPPISFDSTQATPVEPTPFVHLDYAGQGTLSGTRAEPNLRWEVGTVSVHVESNRGLGLVVHTDEAVIRVHGTTFEVKRDTLGTHVVVTEGRVEVACGSDASTFLETAGQIECLPRRPAGLLARARALDDVGLTDQAVQSARLGLTVASPGDPARGELLALRAVLLDKQGRSHAALEDARSYLSEGHVPRAEAMRLLIRKLGGEP
jgi:hypothetical protein